MSTHAAPDRIGFRARLAAAALAAVAIAAVPSVPLPVRAEEGRVAEIRYDVPGPIPLLSPRWAPNRQASVLVTDDRLSPRRITIGEGETVTWISYARGLTRITFEREVAASMVCHSLVNFHLAEDELRSGLLRTGDAASFCELAPGLYRYRVVPHAPEGAHQLSSRLEGVIEVEAVRTAR
ncbi:MAG: hypothetical protein JSU66_16645 [Deltaproteobacteria bacterium]|nr:MAG: hypothetical protein JSU66_16645 [Deltaproteobacteria bacterium]